MLPGFWSGYVLKYYTCNFIISSCIRSNKKLQYVVIEWLVFNPIYVSQLLENLFTLLDSLMVWDNNAESSLNGSTEWVELASIGLRLMLGCMKTESLELVAMAAAKLHHLIHSRKPKSTEEICYILKYLHKIQCKSIEGRISLVEGVTNYSFVTRNYLYIVPQSFRLTSLREQSSQDLLWYVRLWLSLE